MSEPSFLGRGWAFPPTFSAGGADVEMVTGTADIEQSLQILFGTWPGDRVMQEAFGCDMASLKFEQVDQRLINTLQRLVKGAILAHEPRIKLDRVDVTKSIAGPSAVAVTIHYTVKGTNSRFNMVFPFYLTEATPAGG